MDRAIGQKFNAENYEKAVLLYDIDKFFIPILKKFIFKLILDF